MKIKNLMAGIPGRLPEYEKAPEFQNRFFVYRLLGKGTYGKVFVVRERKERAPLVLIKRVKLMDKNDFSEFRREVANQTHAASCGLAPAVHEHWVHHRFLTTEQVRKTRAAQGYGMLVMEKWDGTLESLLNDMWLDTKKMRAEDERWQRTDGQCQDPMVRVVQKWVDEHLRPMLERLETEFMMVHGDCVVQNVVFRRTAEQDHLLQAAEDADALEFALIDWGFSQRFFPSGRYQDKQHPSIRWHARFPKGYDASLLDWNINWWLHSTSEIRGQISIAPAALRGQNLLTHARADIWQGIFEQRTVGKTEQTVIVKEYEALFKQMIRAKDEPQFRKRNLPPATHLPGTRQKLPVGGE